MVFYVFSILAIILVVGMVIEVGWWNYHYYKAQNAADLAALSAAQYVPLSEKDESYKYGSVSSISKMGQAGKTVFWANDGKSGSLEVDRHRKGKNIHCCNWAVVKHRDLHSWLLIDEFMDTISEDFMISVIAYGKAESLYKPVEVVPLALIKRDTTELPYDTAGTVLTGDLTNPRSLTNELGILDMTGGGTMSENNALDWLANNYEGQQGMKVAHEKAGWKTIDSQKAAEALNKRVTPGQKIMIIPVVGPLVDGDGKVTIFGFACFELDSAKVDNGKLSIKGKFVKYIDSKSDRRPDGATAAYHFGVRIVFLDNSVPVP